jgi:protein TonB
VAYVLQATVEPRYRQYGETVTSVELVKPVPPPPPPPPPPPAETPKPAPPKLQPRPPAAVTELPLSVPPLPVPPVEQRIVEARPAAIAAPVPPPAPPPPEPKPSVIENPDWLRRPTASDMARYYPERAQRMNVEGRATIACTVDARGGLEACQIVSESPGDQDFGAAALRMSKLFKMRPMTVDGLAVTGGAVRIPIRFVLPKE